MLLDDSSCQFLLPTLASFVQLVLEGRTTLSIRPFFFGTNLTALHKKDGGIFPITLSCTLRRLVAKIATGKVKEELTSLLAPQLFTDAWDLLIRSFTAAYGRDTIPGYYHNGG